MIKTLILREKPSLDNHCAWCAKEFKGVSPVMNPKSSVVFCSSSCNAVLKQYLNNTKWITLTSLEKYKLAHAVGDVMNENKHR